ncbi:hypothetical protein E2562_037795 [Oryza meyeriana var. granulata]|uniref:Uncharacterized protein n=1 Tax=Oryza meyeriana var. granulata TaxID=110450 RepID=A0A6G1E8B1_9ORYZ|nr:hypothetical protein E2562_037795 [Oryza meyeriana var. granulata]
MAVDLEKQESPAHGESTLHRVSSTVVFLLLLFGPYAWYFINVAIESGKPYYTAKITGIKASNFTEAQDYHTSPSFNITMSIHNHYPNSIYFTDWQFAIFHDGIPLGHGSFPDGFVVNETSDAAGITGTTSSPLLGLAKEVHNHMISSGQLLQDMEFQVDMRLLTHNVNDNNEVLSDTKEKWWLWCTSAKLDGYDGPSICQNRPIKVVRDLWII